MEKPCCRFGSRGFYLINLKSHYIENQHNLVFLDFSEGNQNLLHYYNYE